MDDRRGSAWRDGLPGAPGVDFLDQLRLDPDGDVGCARSHASEMGRSDAPQLDNSSQEVDFAS
jgi:hypothetical protein